MHASRGKQYDSERVAPTLGTDEKPIDTSYYELLNLPVDSDDKAIKKQYRMLAMRWHPDKNKAENAEEKFKEISEAYQILSDKKLRHEYNVYGKKSDLAPDGGFADSQEFFTMMFGGDAFRDIIGELPLGRDLKEAMDQRDATEPSDGNPPAPAQTRPTKEELVKRKQIHDERVAKLAENLIHKLALYVDSNGDEVSVAAFQEKIRLEAEKLKEESFGLELLHSVGYTYSEKSKKYAPGATLPKLFRGIKEKRHIIKETWSTLKSALEVQQAVIILEQAEKRGWDEAQKMQLEEEAAQRILHAIWQSNKFEVESTIRDVCDRVLEDKSITKEVRTRRAEALRMLGYIYKHIEADKPVGDVLLL